MSKNVDETNTPELRIKKLELELKELRREFQILMESFRLSKENVRTEGTQVQWNQGALQALKDKVDGLATHHDMFGPIKRDSVRTGFRVGS